jgi:two-component system sensor kinase FixL
MKSGPTQNTTNSTSVHLQTGERIPRHRLEAVVAGIRDGIVLVGQSGEVEWANAILAQLIGDELAGLPPQQWVASGSLLRADRGDASQPGDRFPFAGIERGEEVEGIELCWPRDDPPHRRWVRAYSRALLDEQGNACGGMVVVQDITDAKRREHERARRRTAALAESSPDAIVIARQTGEIILVNSMTEKMFGYQRNELLGKSVEALMPQRYRPRHEQLRDGYFAKPIMRPMGVQTELYGVRHDGTEFPIDISLNPLRTEDGIVVCSAIRDITERVLLERQMRAQHAELAHSARLTTMGEMAAGMAHEINQPLAAISAYAEGAKVRLRNANYDVSELADVFERIAADSQRASEVVRRMRQFVRKRDTDMMVVDINRLAREVSRFVVHDAVSKAVAIELDLAETMPRIFADPIEIQQVMLNLVRNAMDGMDGMDEKQKQLKICTRPQDDIVEVSVEDSGPGIPTQLVEQVFEPFFTSKEDGLGLGLAISRSIVEAHKGRVTIGQSSLGGARVYFSLPIYSEEDADE